ncbi:hypothetical protein EC973_003414 [Apophysomyces ossiformis]|uniref:B30.2/SPRY domain-containing protein n=1 Tax=Apophysomyces ossiformis TaxID=679940 RepID=A0A8H7BZY8_9FUNG|nr:hypothetical protein EC973_003414 [Apophysomyces ossiformis]
MDEWHPEQFYFNKKEIIPYVDKHWKSICTERVRTPTWWATLGSCLYSSKEVFVARDERQRSAASDFCLVDANLWHVRPTIQSSGKALVAVPRSRDKRKTDESLVTPQTPPQQQHRPLRAEAKWRSSTPATTPSPRSSSPVLTPTTLPAFPSSANTDHPFNRFGFKYIPCEPSILPLVAYQQAEHSPGGCTISIADRSTYVSVTNDGLTVTTDKGFRMCRANVGVKEGNWYWEATIQQTTEKGKSVDPHVRIGWARREACLNAPVGYDAYGYGYRDLTGDKLFCSRPQKYGEPFGVGDVIGLYISLPKRDNLKFKSPSRKRIPIAYKDRLWFEEKDFRPSKELKALTHDDEKKDDEEAYQPRTIPGSSITVYKNGISQGVMFEDLIDFEDFGRLPELVLAQHNKKRKKQKKDGSSMPRMRMEEDEYDGIRAQQWTEDPPLDDDGTLGYYPAVSVFKGGMVRCNFGPDFRFPPQTQEEWKPMSQRYNEYMAEECMWDVLDEVSRYSRRACKTL